MKMRAGCGRCRQDLDVDAIVVIFAGSLVEGGEKTGKRQDQAGEGEKGQNPIDGERQERNCR